MFIVYILYSSLLDKYYIGYTNDLERRLSEHNRKKGKYADGGIPWRLVHQEKYELKSEAMKRERNLSNHKSPDNIFILFSAAKSRKSIPLYGRGPGSESQLGHQKMRRSLSGFSFLILVTDKQRYVYRLYLVQQPIG